MEHNGACRLFPAVHDEPGGIRSAPVWLTSAFAVAVFAGFVGSILLLARKRLAVRMFLLSMIAVFIQFGGLLLFLGYADVLTGSEWIMPILIPIFAVGFYLFARNAEKQSILA